MGLDGIRREQNGIGSNWKGIEWDWMKLDGIEWDWMKLEGN